MTLSATDSDTGAGRVKSPASANYKPLNKQRYESNYLPLHSDMGAKSKFVVACDDFATADKARKELVRNSTEIYYTEIVTCFNSKQLIAL